MECHSIRCMEEKAVVWCLDCRILLCVKCMDRHTLPNAKVDTSTRTIQVFIIVCHIDGNTDNRHILVLTGFAYCTSTPIRSQHRSADPYSVS